MTILQGITTVLIIATAVIGSPFVPWSLRNKWMYKDLPITHYDMLAWEDWDHSNRKSGYPTGVERHYGNLSIVPMKREIVEWIDENLRGKVFIYIHRNVVAGGNTKFLRYQHIDDANKFMARWSEVID